MLRQVSTTGLVAAGMTAVILTAGIDLSVGSIMALCSVVCAMLLTVPGWTPAATMGLPALALAVFVVLAALTRFAFRGAAGGAVAGRRGDAALDPLRGRVLPVAVGLAGVAAALWFLLPQVGSKFGVIGVLLVTPCVGLIVGAINGLIIVGGRLQPFIVTLAMMVTALGVARLTAGQNNAVLPVYTGTNAVAEFDRLRSLVFGVVPVPGPLLPGRGDPLRRGAALHLVRPLRLRDRRQRGGGAAVGHRRGADQDRHLRDLRHAGRRRGGALRGAVPPGQARRRRRGSSSTPSPRW